MVTLQLIAEKSGVSLRTVSVALNGDPATGRIAPQRVQQIRSIAADLGYRPHAGARLLRQRRFKQIGLAFRVDSVSRLAHSQVLALLLGINDALQPHNYVMSLIPLLDSSGPPDMENGHASRALRERALDNLIVVESVPNSVAAWVRDRFPDSVWANADVWQPTRCVRRDETHAGRLAVEHVRERGYKRIVYVERVNAIHHSSALRRNAALQAAAGCEVQVVGLSLEPTLRPTWAPTLKQLILPGDAIVVADVYLARALQAVLVELNLRPGVDVAVCCCDNSDDLYETWPQLARVSFDRFALGHAAGTIALAGLIDADAPQNSLIMPVTLIAGTTCPAKCSLSFFSEELR